jgi:hypothetical protein
MSTENTGATKNAGSTKNARRHHRIPYVGLIQISWEDASGRSHFAQAKCVDISETGLRVEAPEPIPVSTSVMLRAGRINLAGASRVKHLDRYGSKYILGLELSQALRDKSLALIQEPWALRSKTWVG